MSEFYPIQRTRSKKTQVLLRFDTYDYERLDELDPVGITVQEKLRQIIKLFLDGGFEESSAPAPVDDDLDGL